MPRPASPFAPPPPKKAPKVKRDTVDEHMEKGHVRMRDRSCVAPRLVTLPGDPRAMSACDGRLEVDHVRASGGLGIKSPTHRTNLVVLCRHHHDAKTYYGKTWRPLLLAYLECVEPTSVSSDD